MEDNFTPQPGDTSISIPITFDYRGGRSANTKNKIITTIITVVLSVFISIFIFKSEELEIWQKLLYDCGLLWIGLFVIRFVVLKESYYSDIYETLKADDFELKTEDIWQIFEIDFEYPYTCYFRNGQKGIFVRMERDAITGKPENADYYHYEALADAYNTAHACNMNIVHIDYMDNVGNDPRLQKMYEDLSDIENVDMYDMLVDIYNNLQEEMSLNYSSFDIYLFLTRDKFNSFMYNVQTVANKMLGGNFLTYKVLNRDEIAGVCSALFNLHEFSILEACENIFNTNHHSGIIPIKLTKADGEVEKLGKTQEEKRIELEEKQKQIEDAKAEQKRKKENRKRGLLDNEIKVSDDKDLDLFGVDDNIDKSKDYNEVFGLNKSEGTNEDNSISDSDDLNLF